MKALVFIRVLFCLQVFLLFGGCEKPPQSYFPLTEGYRWSYQVTHTTMDGSRQQKYLLTNNGMKEVNGEEVYVRRSLDGTELYYRQEDTGIIYLGSADTTGLHPVYSEDRRLVLAFPLAEETSWEEMTVTRLLEKSGPPQKTEFKIVANVPMEGKIVSLNEVVHVPAGRFDRCIKVEMRGSAFKDAGNYVGLTLVNVKETSWYAPGVGLVKLERLEKTQSDALDKGSLSIALEKFWQG